MNMFGKYTSWKYFITNYESNNIPNTGSHGLLVLKHMDNFVFNSVEYNNKYPEIVNNLSKCKEVSERYRLNNGIKSKEDYDTLQQTADDIYNVVPSLFKNIIKLNNMWINKKRELGFEHDEYKGDKTLLDSFCEKVFH